MTGTIAVFGTNRDTGAVSRDSYGNKAAVLAEMAEIGIPVPPGFALPVEVCEEYYAGGRRLPEWAHGQLALGIAELESTTGLGFGSARRPLMISVRSGAAVSMPGIMQTILNVGLSRETIGGLVFRTGNPRFAWDCYRRLLAQFGEVVRGHDPARYRVLLREAMENEGVPDEAELDTASFRALAGQYERVHAELGTPFPSDAVAQLGDCTGPCSSPGAGPARRPFGASGWPGRPAAPPSRCRRWSSATSGRPRGRGWRSRGTPGAASPASSSTSASERRARRSSRESSPAWTRRRSRA